MPLPTTANSLHLIQTEDATVDKFGTNQRVTALGTQMVIPASRVDRTLFWLDAGHAVIGGPNYQSSDATDQEIKLYANTGEQVWIYVKNKSGAVTRGRRMVAIAGDGTAAGATPFEVAVAGVTDQSIGVCQFDVPDEACCWILREGVGYGDIDADLSELDLLDAAANGEFGAATDESVAQARLLEEITAAGIGLIKLFSSE